MTDISKIAAYEPDKLPVIYQQLLAERMELDLKFSDFLRKNESTMGEDTDTPIWKAYKRMGIEYTKVAKNILLTEHYMKGTQ